MNTFELADQIGVTPRQIDHWCRRGFVPGQVRRPGSGHHREFDEQQVKHLKLMSVLVRNGFQPARASELVIDGHGERIAATLEAK